MGGSGRLGRWSVGLRTEQTADQSCEAPGAKDWNEERPVLHKEGFANDES